MGELIFHLPPVTKLGGVGTGPHAATAGGGGGLVLVAVVIIGGAFGLEPKAALGGSIVGGALDGGAIEGIGFDPELLDLDCLQGGGGDIPAIGVAPDDRPQTET